MRVEKWPSEKPHQISTTFATKIHDVTTEEQTAFKGISLIEGSISGHVEAFHDIYKYESCSKCRCKVDNTMILCGTCNAVLHDRVETFKYELCLNLGQDEMINITGFHQTVKPFVDFANPLPSNEDIEDELNEALEKKFVEVGFTINKKKMEKIVHKININ